MNGTATPAMQPPVHAPPTMLRKLGFIKLAKAIRSTVLNLRPLRKLMTSNYTSGLLALGESNYYGFPPRWITVDWAKSDFSMFITPDMRLPFADNQMKLAYTAHLIEHLADDSLQAMFREAFRVLKPGGGIRIECPDAAILHDAYRRKDPAILGYFRQYRQQALVERLGLDEKYLEDQLTYVGEVSSYIDHSNQSGHIPVYATAEEVDARMDWDLDRFSAWAQGLKTPEQAKSGGHNNAITSKKLETMLGGIGFTSIVRVSRGQTSLDGLSLNNFRRRLIDSIPEKTHRAFYSLYVEAKKPG